MNLWTMVWAAALCGAATLVVVLREGPVLEPAGILVCVALLLLGTMRTIVTVERHGVRARLGLFGFPRRFIGTDTIRRAVVVHVRPVRDFRGWGDRFRGGTRAFVCRRGEGVRIELARGAPFVVTVDGARRVADRINSFVDERAAADRAL